MELNKLFQLQTYVKKLNFVFNNIKNGQLLHMSSVDCFFKLRLKQNHRKIFIHRDDLISRRHNYTTFINDVVVLDEVTLMSRYYLHVSINKYDEKNCRCYLVNTKECGKNRLLEYGDVGNVDITWELYTNAMNEVIFYFKKK